MYFFTFSIFTLIFSSLIFAATPNGSELEVSPIRVYGKRTLKELPAESSEYVGQSLPVESQQGSSLAQILERSSALTSVHSSGEGGEPTFLVRGQDPIQTRYFLEGVPLTDAEFNGGNIALVPLENLKSADIYPEGVPVFLAEDGLGGAVNLRLKTLDDRASYAFGTRAGSYGFFRVFGQGTVPTPVPWQLSTAYSQSTEDFIYFDDNGTPFNPTSFSLQSRTHNQFRRITLLPRLSLYSTANHQLQFFSLNSYGHSEIPGPVNTPAPATLIQFQNVSAIDYSGALGQSFELHSAFFCRLQSEKLSASNNAGLLAVAASSSNEFALGIKGRLKWLGISPHELEMTSGLVWDQFQISYINFPQDQSLKQRYQVPLGLSSKFQVVEKYLIARPAILAHYYQYALTGPAVAQIAAPASPSYFLLSPRVGLTSQILPSIQLRSSVGHYYRAPTMYEIYGTPTGVTPSQSLTYEESDKADIGVDWEYREPVSFLKAVRVSYTYFLSRSRNLISFIQNSQQSKVATNIGKAAIEGHEIEFEAKSKLDLGLRVGLSLLDTQNQSDISYQFGKDLPNRPNYQVRAGLDFEKGGFSASYGISILGPSYWDLANLKQLSSTIEHNASLFWRSKKWGMFGVEGRNLTDVITAASTQGTSQITDNTTGFLGYPVPGRRVYVSWTYEI